MKHFTKVLPVLGLVATVSYVGEAAADFTGNAAATSDYVWRGITQTNGNAAIQGGIDYSAPVGIYVGAWTSNTDFGDEFTKSYELDLYAGYAFELGPVAIDVGYVGYIYPQTDDDPSTVDFDEGDIDFNEGYLGVGFEVGKTSWLVKANYSSDVFATGQDGLYLELGLDIPIKDDLVLAFHVGNYNFDVDDPKEADFAGFDDYTDYSVSLTKGDFTFTWSDTDLNSDIATDPLLDFDADEDAKIFVTWSKEWDLLK